MNLKRTAVGMFAVGISAAAQAQTCATLDNYDVQPTSYTNLPIAEAVQKLVKGMPFQIQQRGLDDVQVSANNVAGPLDKVLEVLSRDANVKYRRDRCIIVLQRADEDVWSIKAGTGLREAMESWAKRVSWQLAWEIDGDISIQGDASFQGTHERAVSDLVDALNQSGEALSAIFYAGNNTLRFTRTK